MILDLENLRDRNRNPHWILAGDFNIIATLAEKKGGIRRLDIDAEVFSAFIEKTKLVDIKTSNGQFTWNNKRTLHQQIASILDKFLILESIVMQGIIMEGNILPWGGSDHWPVLLEANFQVTPKNRPFWFESFWIEHPTFKENIKIWWKESIQEIGEQKCLNFKEG
jgi:hypothetical protein